MNHRAGSDSDTHSQHELVRRVLGLAEREFRRLPLVSRDVINPIVRYGLCEQCRLDSSMYIAVRAVLVSPHPSTIAIRFSMGCSSLRLLPPLTGHALPPA